jgi:hypothetical protein
VVPQRQTNIRDRAASYTWFYIDESGFLLGMKVLSNLTIDYMEMQSKKVAILELSILKQNSYIASSSAIVNEKSM